MTILVKKANNDFWYKIKEFNTLEDLMHYKDYCRHDIILSKNFLYGKSIEKIMLYNEKITLEDAKIISEIQYKICIYNSYIE